MSEKLFFHKEHTWAKIEGEQVKVGITNFAQEELGDIIFIELPEIGAEFSQGEVFGQAESTKTVSDLHMPVSGKVVAINEELENDPELVNREPYNSGWMLLVEPKDLKETENLLSQEEYKKQLEK